MRIFPRQRLRSLDDCEPRSEGRFVLYWMTATRRLSWSFALDRALDFCRELRRPLLILEELRSDEPLASARSHRFALDGMAEHHGALAESDVTYYPYVEKEAGAALDLLEALAARASVVVTDDHPGSDHPHRLAAAEARLGRGSGVRLEAVDSCGLVPVRLPGRAFPTAYAFRRWLQRHLPDLLGEHPSVRPLARHRGLGRARLPAGIRRRWPAATAAALRADSPSSDALIRGLPIDQAVAPVPGVRGGATTARRALREFLHSRLDRYADEANRPEADATSGLSPWLRFGHLSPHEVFTAVTRAEGWSPASLSPRADGRREGWWGLAPSAESFLDQLVTWREIGFNAAVWLRDHDRWKSLPDWARASLSQHAGDPREHLYTREQLERAETHDPLWNAAQRQLTREGRIHNYVRMLWGKKILEWSPTPRDALATMLHLNDKYALDGRDPNSVNGIFWVLGRYDRAWGPERDVFGKVRYMSSANTARKVSVKGYLARYAGPKEGAT